MGGDIDRRAVVFLGFALACALLAPMADGYAWVAIAVAAVYTLLAAASWLDHRSRRNGR